VGDSLAAAGGAVLWRRDPGRLFPGRGGSVFPSHALAVSLDCIRCNVCARQLICRYLIGELFGQWPRFVSLFIASPLATGRVEAGRQSDELVPYGCRTGIGYNTAVGARGIGRYFFGGDVSVYPVTFMIRQGSMLWQYLSPEQRALASDGDFLLKDSALHADPEPTDYSYLVFPYAKLYEGFLKDLFRDLGIIDERAYRSDHFRIGKVLSPNLVRRLGGRSAYAAIENRYGKDLATRLWHAWKEGRNLVFHYFPHNYRALTRDRAAELTTSIQETMEEAVRRTRARHIKEA